MKQYYNMAALIITTVLFLSSCCNAGAKNDKNESGRKAVTELNSTTFSEKVYDMNGTDLKYLGDKPAIVDFTASWCGPCQRLAPVLEELATEYKGKIEVYKVDVDKCRDLAQAFEISSIPALLFIPTKGKPSMMVGLRSKKQLTEEIESVLLGK